MNTSVIRYRVADFLKSHAPFNAVPEQDLIDLAGQGRVRFHEADEYLFRQSEAAAPWLSIIQQGKVELLEESSGASQLRDVLEEGDLLGIERLFGDGLYLSSARTLSEVILYAIDFRAFQNFAARHAAVRNYLSAHFSLVASDIGRRSWLDAEAPDLAFLQARSRRMKSAGSPVAVFPALEGPLTTRAAVRHMLRTSCEALTVGVDGDAILTASDLALFCDRNPALLVREIRQASGVDELAPLLRQAKRLVQDGFARPSDVDDCAGIATEIAAACAAACLGFADLEAVSAGVGQPPVRYCWLAFGTLARGEVMRPEAAKIGVIYDDGCLDEVNAAILYFNIVSGRLDGWFAACGIEGAAPVWPKGSHPCMPLSEWKRLFQETIREPLKHDLFSRRELFDIRELSGDLSIVRELTGCIDRELEAADMLMPLLANDTLSSLPPLTVFHGRVLDSDGVEHQSLDLTEAIINPVSDAARVFALSRKGSPVATLERLKQAALDFPAGAAIFHDAAEAFCIAFYHQTMAGTPVISPSALGKLDQRAMKTAFSAVRRLLELATSTFVAPL